MKRLIVSFIVAVALTASHVSAAVVELWRSAVTNSFPAGYQVRTAVVDSSGNTIVGGTLVVGIGGFGGSGMVAKFDSEGNNLWIYRTEPNAFLGIDALAIDEDGNIFFTIRFNPIDEERYLALIKLDPDGKELWRIVENDVARLYSTSFFPSAVQLDSKGNAVMTAVLSRQISPDRVVAEQVVSKFDENGNNLWRVILPGYGVLFDWGYLKTLSFTHKDEIIVVGGSSTLLYPQVTKLDKHGRLDWWTDEYDAPSAPTHYSSVTVNSKGIVAAAAPGEGTSIFSRRGQLQYFHPTGDEIMGITADDGFLVRCQGYLCALDSTGSQELWQFAYYLTRLLGVVPDGTGGWIAVGGSNRGSGIDFVGISQDGRELWREFLATNRNSRYGEGLVFGAPDGTLRLVAPVGLAVEAFAIE